MRKIDTALAINLILVIIVIVPSAYSCHPQQKPFSDRLTHTSNAIKLYEKQIYNARDNETFFNGYRTMEPLDLQPFLNKDPPIKILDDIPNEFSWKNYQGYDWTTSAKNQGDCGSCWAFAPIAMLETIINIREDCPLLNPDLSEQYLLSCLPDAGDCIGGSPYHALEYATNTSSKGNNCNGIILESCLPYEASDTIPCSDKISDWKNYLISLSDIGYWWSNGNTTNIEIIKSWILEHGSIVSTFYASDNFMKWGRNHHSSDDVFRSYKIAPYQNHIAEIVGWKDDQKLLKGGYWICKNSWGPDWGHNGFFNVEYNALSIDIGLIIWADYNPDDYDWSPVPVIDQCYTGFAGEEVLFDASGCFDPEGNIISYCWDFGDGLTGSSLILAHMYAEKGVYQLTLSIVDENGKNATTSSIVRINDETNNFPSTPIIEGPSSGKQNVEYLYSFSAYDPDGDELYFFADWGDGTYEMTDSVSSGDEVTVSHTWDAEGIYEIKAKSIDQYGAESDWATLEVSMPKNKVKNLGFFNFTKNYPFLFPFLRLFLNLKGVI